MHCFPSHLPTAQQLTTNVRATAVPRTDGATIQRPTSTQSLRASRIPSSRPSNWAGVTKCLRELFAPRPILGIGRRKRCVVVHSVLLFIAVTSLRAVRLGQR